MNTKPVPAAAVLPHIERIRNKPWRKQLARRTYALEDGTLLHVGDLKADELVVGRTPLVVTGDVVVQGIVRDRHRADESLLIVLGDLTADRIVTGGASSSLERSACAGSYSVFLPTMTRWSSAAICGRARSSMPITTRKLDLLVR